MQDDIEQQNQETRKLEQAAENMKTRCNTCFKETSPNPQCFGHGTGEGNQGSDSDETENKTSQTTDDFNSEVVSELVSKKLLLIEDNKESGILSLKLQWRVDLLSDEQRNELENFFHTILKISDEFKTINKTLDKYSLRISTLTPALYDAFIQKLNSQNLLLTQPLEQKEKEESRNGEGYSNTIPLSPYLTRPKPKGIDFN